MSQEPHSIGEVVDTLEEIGQTHKQPDVGDFLDAFGCRRFAPFMLMIALLILAYGGIAKTAVRLTAIGERAQIRFQ